MLYPNIHICIQHKTPAWIFESHFGRTTFKKFQILTCIPCGTPCLLSYLWYGTLGVPYRESIVITRQTEWESVVNETLSTRITPVDWKFANFALLHRTIKFGTELIQCALNRSNNHQITSHPFTHLTLQHIRMKVSQFLAAVLLLATAIPAVVAGGDNKDEDDDGFFYFQDDNDWSSSAIFPQSCIET